ncbi:ankyrin repeat-containing domain protein, partial [Sphaerosporella brunnea]
MSSTPPFPALPTETLFDVGDLLTVPDLSALSQTCRAFHVVFTLPLFRRVQHSPEQHLFHVMQNNNVRLLTYLLDEGLPVDCTMTAFECAWPRPVCTLLHFAADSGSDALVRLLIDRGANISAATTRNPEPQVRRAWVAYFESLDADVGWTPLHCAAVKGHDVVAMLLIDNGAAVCTTAEDESTPLHWAAYAGHATMRELLIENGAVVCAARDDGETPLHCAASESHPVVCELLISKGANVSAVTTIGHTPLFSAAWLEDEEVARTLIANGADVSIADKGGRTPLHDAAICGQASVARLLIEN